MSKYFGVEFGTFFKVSIIPAVVGAVVAANHLLYQDALVPSHPQHRDSITESELRIPDISKNTNFNPANHSSHEKRATELVVELLSEAIDAHESRPVDQFGARKAKVWLPRSRSDRNLYAQAYSGLAEELGALPSVDSPHPFYSDYARLMLKGIRLFSRHNTESACFFSEIEEIAFAPWKEGKKSDQLSQWVSYYYSSAVTKQRSEIGQLQARLELDSNPGYQKALTQSDEELFEKFEQEIDLAVQSGTNHYRWFTVFWNRLSFLATAPKFRYKNLINHNAGFSQYVSFPDVFDIWRTHETQLKYFELTGDRLTQDLYSPLAMMDLFPFVIMIPYPYSLNVVEINYYTPTKKMNVYPIGLPYWGTKIDGIQMFPHVTAIHDVQHLAIFRFGMSALASYEELTPLEIEKLNQLLNLGYQAFAKAVDELRVAIENMPATDETEKRKKKEFEFFLFEVSHENFNHLSDRIFRLLQTQMVLPGVDKFDYAKTFLPINGESQIQSVQEMYTYLYADYPKWIKFVKNHLSERTYLELVNSVPHIAKLDDPYVLMLRGKFPELKPIDLPKIVTPLFGAYTRRCDRSTYYWNDHEALSMYLSPIEYLKPNKKPRKYFIHYFKNPFDVKTYQRVEIDLNREVEWL